MNAPVGGWAWAVLRLVAFIGLLSLFVMLLGAVWSLLPIPATTTLAFLSASITAGAAVLAGVFLLRFADARPAAALGIGISRLTLPHVAIGLAIGFVALIAAAFALLVTGFLRYEPQAGTIGAWVSVVALQGGVFTIAAFAEEALFRGYAFQVLTRWAGAATAVLATSLLFAVAHGANPEVGPIALVNIFLAGVMLGVAYLRTLSLWFATAVHVGWNWAMATWFDLPVSGIAAFDTPLYQPTVGGPAWWSGGAFGPEGGLVGTIGFGVAVAALYLRFVRPDPAIRGARPLFVELETEQA